MIIVVIDSTYSFALTDGGRTQHLQQGHSFNKREKSVISKATVCVYNFNFTCVVIIMLSLQCRENENNAVNIAAFIQFSGMRRRN